MAESVTECSPTDQVCRDLVQKIVSSNDFRRAPRLREFLQYVVDRKLASAPHEATESVIGHRVFGRPAHYNTGEDSIVRTEARLLRQRLERYFNEEGAGEPIVLEIPKGSYVPVFHRREQPPAQPLVVPAPPKLLSKLQKPPLLWILLGACLACSAFAIWRLGVDLLSSKHPAAATSITSAPVGAIELESSDPVLVKGFESAKRRALAYTYNGDAVGDWYDSTAGTRYAFCMRDVSHQSIGAAVLGVTGHTHNMLHRFAASISASRDWCGFWEINKDGFPAPVDYTDDRHFWYNLPANFDVMRAAYRQFLWTGDRSYFDSVFSNFYDRTVTDYVAAWDPNHDGGMRSSPQVRPRGIASYYQEEPHLEAGADLLAAQYAGYLSYAAIQEQKGAHGSLSKQLASEYIAKAQALRTRYNTEWWNPFRNRYYSILLDNHRFSEGNVNEPTLFALLFGITEDGPKTEAALDSIEQTRPELFQAFSYYPEVLFQYGRNESAYRNLLDLMDPAFKDRNMPEVVFSVIGATAAGLAGISPDARQHLVETLPHLPKALAWINLRGVRVLQNGIAVQHRGVTETTFTNQSGQRIQWKAAFPLPPGDAQIELLVDGIPAHGQIEQGINKQRAVFVLVPVEPGQTRTTKRKLTVS